MPLNIRNINQDDEERRRREQASSVPVSGNQQIQTPQYTQPQNAQQSLLRREDNSTNKWYKGANPTNSEIQAQIFRMGQNDPVKAEEAWNQYQAFRQDPTSPIYDPYSKGTNYALTALSEMGIDTSGGITPDWVAANQGYLQYLKYNQAGNIQAPTKRSKKEEKIAYQVYQVLRDEDKTVQAESEWSALQEELSYWATRKDLNLSDEQVRNKIDWSKYKTLTEMDAGRESGNPISLNRAIGYSQDAISGVIWAARNGVTGDDGYNSVRAALGQGKQYQYDEALAQRLTPGSATYAPYSVCTLDKAALYFGVDSFDQQWLNEHMTYRDSGDETAREMYESVYKAEQTTRKAEEEMAALREQLDKKLVNGTDPDRVWKSIDLEKNYPTLYKMNETRNGGPLLMTTRAVDFDLDAIRKDISDRCDHNKKAKTGKAICKWFSDFTGIPVEYDENLLAVDQTRSDNINSAAETIELNGTPEEQVVFSAGSSPSQDADMLTLGANLDSETFDGQKSYDYIYGEADAYAAENYLGAHAVITEYEQNATRLDEIENELSMLERGVLPGESEEAPAAQQEEPAPSAGASIPKILTTASTGMPSTMPKEVQEILAELKERGIDNPLSPDLTPAQQAIVDEVFAAHGGTKAPQSFFVDKDVEKEKQIEIERNKLLAEQEKLKAENESHESDYQEALRTRGTVMDNYTAADEVAGLTDAERDGGYKMPTTLDRYYELGAKREPTQWNSDNLYELAVQEGHSFEEVSRAAIVGKFQYAAQIAEIDSILNYLDSYDWSFSDEYFQNIMDRRSYYLREIQAADDFLLQGNADYGDTVDRQLANFRKQMEDPKAKATAQFVGANGGLATGLENNGLSSLSQEILMQESGLWDEWGMRRSPDPLSANSAYLTEDMTSQERRNYIYILATKGEDAAKAFYDRLTDDTYGVVTTRAAKNFEENFKQFGEEHPGAASVLSIIMSPFGAASNTIYTIGQKIKGEEASPYSMASYATIAKDALQGAATEEVQSWADKTFGEGSIGSSLIGLVYGGGMSAFTSLANSFVYGGLDFGSASATGLSKFLRKGAESFVSAMPMGLGASDAAIRDVELRNGSIDQALLAGAVTFLCETATEAVTLENIGEARNFGKAGDIKSYLWNAVTKYLDEPIAEGLNQAIEDLSDDWIMGEDGKRHQRIQELIEGGMTPDAAEQQAWMEFMGSVGTAMASAAISSGISTGFSWLQGRVTGGTPQATAEQREQQVEERGNVAEVDTSDDSVQQAQIAENIEQVEANGNVVEPTEYEGRHRRNVEGYEALHEATPDPNEVVVSVPETDYAGRHTPSPEVVVSHTIPNGSRVARQIELLGMASGANPAGQAASMGAVLLPSGKRDLYSVGLASAAGQHLQSKYGASAVRMLRNVVTATARNGAAVEGVTDLITAAAMADEGSAAAQALDVIVDEANTTGTVALEDLQGFQAIVLQYMQLPGNVDAMFQKVKEHLTASKVRDAVANGALNAVSPFEQALSQAQEEQQDASEALKREEDTRTQMQDSLKNAHQEFIADAGNAKKQAAVVRVVNDLDGQNKVVEEYTMRRDKADQAVTDAEKQLNQKRNETLAPIREQAAAEVEQELQAERQQQAEAAAAAQQAAVAAEQAAQEAQHQQTLQDQRSGKLKEESTRAKLQRRAQQKGLTGQAAENYVNSVLQHARDRELNKLDMSKQLSATEADLVMGSLERRFGVKVHTEELADGINGYYDKASDSITLNSKLPAGQILVEFGLHELTHSLEQTGAYQQYHDTVLNILFPTQAERDSAVADKIAGYNGQGIRIDSDQALREIVADFTRTRLNSKDVVQRMVDGGLGGRMRAALHNINQFLRNKLTRMDPETRQVAENLRRAERMFQRALNEKEKANKQRIDELNRQANTPEGKLQREAEPVVSTSDGTPLTSELRDGTMTREYSVASWTEEQKAKVKAALIKYGYTPEEAQKWIDDVNGVAATILADPDRLDYKVTDPNKTMLKPNQDYYFTVDASTLCAKRLLYQGTFDAIQHLLPNTALQPEDLIDLSNMMRDMGYETPCGICYVESRRRWLGKYAKEWLDKYDGEYKPKLEEVTTSDGLEKLRLEHPEAYNAFDAAMKAKGSANPKVVQLRTDYRGEIAEMSEGDVEKVKAIGGLRVQSFSDFEVPHLIDMMQAVLDMSSRGLTSQAYTKVPAFAAVFGNTGIKINLSLIGKDSGLDANGDLIFDDVEGMPFAKAMELRDKYSENVGTILVGMNDEHIIKAMGDNRIDFIIPFHKSGWSQNELDKMPVLNSYSDYTNSQNERIILGKKTKVAKKGVGQKTVQNWIAKEGADHPGYTVTEDENGKFTISYPDGYETESFQTHKERTKESLSNYEPVGAHAYWQFEKSGQENAEFYLEKCKKDGRLPKFSQFLVDNGDGSFSLPKGDDPRSTAIRKGYWKTLIDFKMYDNNGVGAEQKAVTPNVNMDEAMKVLNDYSLDRTMPDKDKHVTRVDNNSLPVAQDVVEAYVQQYMDKHPGQEYSAGMGEMTTAQMDAELDSMEDDRYMEAVNSGDMQTAQANVEQAAQQAGYTDKAYHGTANFGFTEFDMDRGAGTIFVSYGLRTAQSYSPDMSPVRQLTDSPRNAYAYHGKQLEALALQYVKEMDGDSVESISYNPQTKRFAIRTNTFVGMDVFPNDFTIPERELQDYLATEFDNLRSGVYQLYTRPGKQFVVDANGATWDDISVPEIPGRTVDTRDVANYAREAGYDSVRINNVYDTGFADESKVEHVSDIGIFFNSEDVKSADPITYDGNGNIIPPSKRFNPDNPDLRYSAGTDEMTRAQLEQEYQEALDANDPDWQAQVVNQAATAAGYVTAAYHGSPVKDITSFNTRSEETKKQKLQLLFGTHFTQTKSFADIYAKKAVNSKGTSRMTSKTGRVYNAYLDLGKSLDLRTARNYTPGTEMYSLYEDLPANIKKKVKPFTFSAYDTAEGLGEGNFITASLIEDALQMMSPKEATDFLVDHGYNSVLYMANYNTGMSNNRFGRDPSIIMLDPERIKSGDPITYDDNGNIIPLSERFNPTTNDIRYSADDGAMSEEQMEQELIDAGVITPDESMPQRQFGYRTAQQSTDLDQRVKNYLYTHSAYTPDSNRAQVDRAIEWIHQMADTSDPSGFRNALQTVADGTFDSRGADGQARLLTMMSLAATQGSISDQLMLADFYNKEGTTAGQQLQARKLFRLMTPIGRIATLKQEANRITDELARKGVKTDIQLSDWTLQAAANAQSEEDFEKVRKAANQEIADQLPVSWKERLQSWRMLAMLANPRTHVRNFIGNMFFVPAVGLKNKLGAAMELAKPAGQRTKTLSVMLPQDIKNFAIQDADNIKDVLTGEAKYSDRTAVQRNKQTLPGFLHAINEYNSGKLEQEDWFFLKGHYRRALGGWMQANGYTVAQMQANPGLLEQGRAYAVQEAQKATYRDANLLAKTLNDVSRKGGALGMFVDAVLPFKKTPANILKRGIEYSPVGLVKSLTADALHLKQYRDWQNGQYSKMPDKAISPNQWIDNLCSGLSGTAIFAVGAILSNMGIISIGLDDDDDEFDKLEGAQEYSVKIFGHSYTLDWAAPACMPFFVGAAVREQFTREGGFDIQEMLNATANIAEPVFNLSMLDGVNSLFRTSQYDETNNLTQILAKVGTNYATSYWPSLFGAAARSFDPVRRKAFVKSGESGGVLGQIRYAVEQTENKIPGVSQTNIPMRDAFGRTESDNIVEKLLENFVSPGYHTTMQNDPVVEELRSLYEATGNRSMIPKLPNKTLTVNKQSVALEAEQYDQLTEERGSTAYSIISDLMASSFYRDASEQDKAEMITDAWTYATQTANHSVDSGYKMDTWVQNSLKNPTRSILNRAKDRIDRDYKEGCKIAAVEAVESGDLDALDTALAKFEETDGKKSSIKTAVGNAYKEDYIRAYQEDDYATMDEIEALLEITDLGFSEKDFQKWIDSVENQIREDEEDN